MPAPKKRSQYVIKRAPPVGQDAPPPTVDSGPDPDPATRDPKTRKKLTATLPRWVRGVLAVGAVFMAWLTRPGSGGLGKLVGGLLGSNGRTVTKVASAAQGDIGALLEAMKVDAEPAMPTDMFQKVLLPAMEWCNPFWPEELQQQADAMAKGVLSGRVDPNAMTNLGNFVVRAVESHMAGFPATHPQLAEQNQTMMEERRAGLLVAMELFRRAVAHGHHFGALYSRGLALRLYPVLLKRDPVMAAWSSERDLCASQEVALQSALLHKPGAKGHRPVGAKAARPPPELVFAVGGCDAVQYVSDWTADERVHDLNATGTPKDTDAEAKTTGGRKRKASKRGKKPTKPDAAFLTRAPPFVARIRGSTLDRPIVVQGMDAVIHDFPEQTLVQASKAKGSKGKDSKGRGKRANNRALDGEGQAPTTCTVFQSTARCYPAMWRQFQATPGRSGRAAKAKLESHRRHIPRLASVAHFSGGQYFHWLMDGLPRLLMLVDELRGEPVVPLLLPAATGGAQFVAETVELVKAQQGEAWPFSETLQHDPLVATSTDELIAVHWRNDLTDLPGSQLNTPAPLLKRVRSALVPRARKGSNPATLVVFVQRSTRESRALVNEDAAAAAVKQVATSFGLGFELFDGFQRGMGGAVELFPRAVAVVGVHGAGLANAIFCRPGATMVEVALPEPEFGEFKHLARSMDLAYQPLVLPASQFESQVWADPDALAEVVREAILRSTLVDL